MTGPGNNTYLLVGSSGSATLIDAGIGEPQHLADLAAELTARTSALATVLVTHGHRDHAGGAPAIASAHPAAVFAKRPWPGQDAHDGIQWRWLSDGDIVTGGDDRLTVLHTPGHSPDHLAFWHEPTRTMFTGDLVVQGSSVMIHWSGGGDLSQYLASLERILLFEPRRLLPAHGVAVDNPQKLLTGYIEHRRMREQQVIEALGAGHGTVQTITESIYHGLGPSLLPAARENVRAHLEKLKTDGLARNEHDQWTL
jgi:glyoxylase-like metal-dependent hydrolase (beta-lactamase superfamily II)